MIRDNVFEGNEASSFGGGIYCNGGSATIAGNTFTANRATSFGPAGAIGCFECTGTVMIHRNLFQGNGGEQCDHGGAIAAHDCEGVTILDNLFVGNQARGSLANGGGAIFAYGTPTTALNNTFVANWVGMGQYPPQQANSYGGAVHIRQACASAANNVFSGDMAQYGNSVAATGEAYATVSHCDAYPGDGSSNYYSEPLSTLVWQLPEYQNLFTGPDFCLGGTSHQYWLGQSSPLRGAGDPNVVPVGDVDLDGRPRPGTNGVDIGAYEDNPQCE